MPTLVRSAACVFLMLVAPACAGDAARLVLPDADSPRLTARPGSTERARGCAPGEHELRTASGRRALMRVSRATGGPGRALLVALHGAGSGGAPGGLWAFRGAWSVPDLVIVAPAACRHCVVLRRDGRAVCRPHASGDIRTLPDRPAAGVDRRVFVGGGHDALARACQRRPLPLDARVLRGRFIPPRAGRQATRLRRARHDG